MTNNPTTPPTAPTNFSTLTSEERELAKKYINGTAWYFLHPNDNNERSKVIKEKIKKLHASLLSAGLTEEQLKILRQKANKFLETPEKDLTPEQFVLLVKLVFL